MENNTRKSTSKQTVIEMRKLIVEAPQLKEGQTDSSGGIRENGKISVQYKNPVPYVEPNLPPAVTQKPYTRKDILKDQAKDFILDVGIDIVSMLWYEYVRPYFKAKLHQLSQKAVVNLETLSKSIQSLDENNKIVDAECVEIQGTDNCENGYKIIHFPQERVG